MQSRDHKEIFIGVWLSLARAPGLGPGGRRFESCHPDELLIPEVRHQSGFRDFVVLKITPIFGYPWLPWLP